MKLARVSFFLTFDNSERADSRDVVLLYRRAQGSAIPVLNGSFAFNLRLVARNVNGIGVGANRHAVNVNMIGEEMDTFNYSAGNFTDHFYY